MEADDLINCTYRAALFAAAASTTPLQQGDDSAATDSFLRRVNSSLLVGFEAMQDLPINTLKMRFVQCAFTAGEAIFTSAAGRPAHVEAALAALSLAAAASAELTDTAATLSTRSTRSGVRAALTDDERVLVSNLPALRINGCHVMTLRARAFLALGHVERSKQAAVMAEEALALASKDEGAGGVHLACLSLKLQLAIEVGLAPCMCRLLFSIIIITTIFIITVGERAACRRRGDAEPARALPGVPLRNGAVLSAPAAGQRLRGKRGVSSELIGRAIRAADRPFRRHPFFRRSVRLLNATYTEHHQPDTCS